MCSAFIGLCVLLLLENYDFKILTLSLSLMKHFNLIMMPDVKWRLIIVYNLNWNFATWATQCCRLWAANVMEDFFDEIYHRRCESSKNISFALRQSFWWCFEAWILRRKMSKDGFDNFNNIKSLCKCLLFRFNFPTNVRTSIITLEVLFENIYFFLKHDKPGQTNHLFCFKKKTSICF